MILRKEVGIVAGLRGVEAGREELVELPEERVELVRVELAGFKVELVGLGLGSVGRVVLVLGSWARAMGSNLDRRSVDFARERTRDERGEAGEARGSSRCSLY